jgi:hypothetical protein
MIADISLPDRRIFLAHRALAVLWLLAVLAAVRLLPSAFEATQTDWLFNEVARTVSGVSYETATAVVAGAQLALAGLMLATAATLLSRPPQTGLLLAALALTTLPFTFGLVGNAAPAYPSPWRDALGAATALLAASGGVAGLALLFLFPNGRFFPVRMRALVLIGLTAVALGVALTYLVENGWWVFIFALIITIFLGVGGQALRYRHADAPSSAGWLASRSPRCSSPFGHWSV